MRFVLVVVMLMILSVPVLGQYNEPIPACEVADIREMAEVLGEYVNVYADVGASMQDDELSAEDLQGAYELREAWLTEGMLEMPICAGSIAASRIFERMVTELLFVMIYSDMNIVILVDNSSERMADLTDELGVVFDELLGE